MNKNTIAILQSFATINQGIVFNQGNVLRTMSPAKNIFGTATVTDEFPKDFAIYNLPEFLSVLGLFDAPTIQYGDEYVTISQGKIKVRYIYSNPEMILSPPKDKNIPIRDPQLVFNVTKEQLTAFLKASAILKSTEMVINKTGITAVNSRGSDNSYHLDIEDMEGDTDENFAVRIDNLKLIPTGYKVTVTDRLIAFESDDPAIEISYIMTLERGA